MTPHFSDPYFYIYLKKVFLLFGDDDEVVCFLFHLIILNLF
jgi:hypothetical protein